MKKSKTRSRRTRENYNNSPPTGNICTTEARDEAGKWTLTVAVLSFCFMIGGFTGILGSDGRRADNTVFHGGLIVFCITVLLGVLDCWGVPVFNKD